MVIPYTDCRACPLYKTATNIVPPITVGDKTDILFVGEAPGEVEDQRGIPFVGKAGQLLERVLFDIGLTSNFTLTNILKHRPPKNSTPTDELADLCGNLFLEEEIDLYKPRLIVCLGKTSTKFFLRKFKISPETDRLRGLKLTLQPLGIDLISTWHPAYILRVPHREMELREDLLFAKEVVREKSLVDKKATLW